MIRLAAQSDFPLVSQRLEEVDLDSGATFILDSLYLPQFLGKPFPFESQRHALLLHGLPARGLDTPGLGDFLEKMRLVFVPGVLFSQSLSSRFPSVSVVVVEPGVDGAFLSVKRRLASSRSLSLVTVASLQMGKRPLELLALLAKTSGDWTWDWIGETGLDSGLRRHFLDDVSRYRLEGRVRLHSAMSQDRLAGFLAGMDLMLFASCHETYGMAIAEAQAMGLPVLTTNVGDAGRLVRDGFTGRLVSGGLVEFGYQLEKILEDPEILSDWRRNVPQEKPRVWADGFGDLTRMLSLHLS